MSTLGAGVEGRVTVHAAGMTSVFYTLDGIEQELSVPVGGDRWEYVARAVGLRRRRKARALEPPSHDCGSRSWTLPVELRGRWMGVEVVPVVVRW